MVNIQTCPGCEGDGKIKCPLCKGRGKVSKKGGLFETMECPECDGIGELVCRLCGGVGKIRDTAEARPAKRRGIFDGL